MEAKVDAATQDVDAFSQGGPAMETPPSPTACTHFLVIRANALEGCTEGLPEEAELAELVAVIEAYEVIRWPLGRT